MSDAEAWAGALPDAAVIEYLASYRAWVLRCRRDGTFSRVRGVASFRALKRECRARGLCTKAARPPKGV